MLNEFFMKPIFMKTDEDQSSYTPSSFNFTFSSPMTCYAFERRKHVLFSIIHNL